MVRDDLRAASARGIFSEMFKFKRITTGLVFALAISLAPATAQPPRRPIKWSGFIPPVSCRNPCRGWRRKRAVQEIQSRFQFGVYFVLGHRYRGLVGRRCRDDCHRRRRQRRGLSPRLHRCRFYRRHQKHHDPNLGGRRQYQETGRSQRQEDRRQPDRRQLALFYHPGAAPLRHGRHSRRSVHSNRRRSRDLRGVRQRVDRRRQFDPADGRAGDRQRLSLRYLRSRSENSLCRYSVCDQALGDGQAAASHRPISCAPWRKPPS